MRQSFNRVVIACSNVDSKLLWRKEMNSGESVRDVQLLLLHLLMSAENGREA
jgi:hypothetical protein